MTDIYPALISTPNVLLLMFVIDLFIEEVREIGHICAIFFYIPSKGEQ